MPPPVLIRRAQPEEAACLSGIAHASKRHWKYPEAWMTAWRENLTFTSAYVAENPTFVAEIGGDPIACYALLLDAEGWHLAHLWITPPYIGRGLGRVLVEHAATTARALGADALLIDSDPNAEAFYLRMGAERVGEIPAEVCGTPRALPRLRYALGGER